MRVNPDFVLFSYSFPQQINILLFNRYDHLDQNEFKNSKTNSYTKSQLIRSESENEKYSLFLHGKVFYRKEYSHDSTGSISEQDLLYQLVMNGESFLKKLKGEFLIFLYDSQNKSVKLYTDQLHAYTYYYYFSDSLLIISSSFSEIISILRDNNIQLKINNHALIEYYLFDYILNNETFIENIYETGPGEIIELKKNKISIDKHYDVFKDLNFSGPDTDQIAGIEILKDVFNHNVNISIQRPETIAVALTGGYDSRSLIASLGNNFKEYQYYSYGKPESWDIMIPQLIADKIGLNYKPFLLGSEFEEQFTELGEKALMLSDGTGRLTNANYVYIYSSFFPGKSSIMTGLFGSELIKRISGPNLAMNSKVLALLTSKDLEKTVISQLKDTWQDNFFSQEFINPLAEAVISKVLAHELVNNRLPQNQKVFLHFLRLGIPKYFQKELKIQSPWVSNLHPFFDLDFINALMKTPFPNVYSWNLKKSLVKNLKTHKLYGALIDQKPVLSEFISTHGFKPKYLRHKIYTPLLAMDFYRYKKKIKADSSMTFNDLNQKALQNKISQFVPEPDSPFYSMIQKADQNNPEFLKMYSLYYWLKAHGIES